jgi:hypothetical protein
MAKVVRSIGPYERGGRVVSGHRRGVHVADGAAGDRREVSGALRNGVVQVAGADGRTYPDPVFYAASKVRWWEAIFRGRRRYHRSSGGNFSDMWTTNLVRGSTGEGVIRTKRQGRKIHEYDFVDQVIGPGVTISRPLRTKDLRRANLRDAFIPAGLSDVDLRGANLDGIHFSPKVSNYAPHGSVTSTTFEGASCVDADFRGVKFFGEVSFRGANLHGANFDGAHVAPGGVLDLRDTNVTREQLDALVDSIPSFPPGPRGEIRYPSFSFEEACENLGVDGDELAVRLWAGDVEVRDRHGRVVSDGSYNEEEHRICIWTQDA